ATTSIQVLLQAAEFLEHRDHRNPPGLAEAEHGYASLCPARSRRAVGSVRSVHNALEKHRYRGVRGERRGRGWLCLCAHSRADRRVTPPPPGRRRAQLRLRRRLEWLLLPTDGERPRADSLDSSQLSEPSEGEDAEVEVDGMVFGGDLLHAFGTGRDHSYSSLHSPES
ncbi:MAD3 protein, partial [Cephalopterus ornatus]|nr:MAD3 protein [Cephalopterus ornatus]